MPGELQTKQALEMTFGVSNGFYQKNGRQMVNTHSSPTKHVLTTHTGVKVYGFLTVAADAKCGVCAHEIGHLGDSVCLKPRCATANNFSLWLARLV